MVTGALMALTTLSAHCRSDSAPCLQCLSTLQVEARDDKDACGSKVLQPCIGSLNARTRGKSPVQTNKRD